VCVITRCRASTPPGDGAAPCPERRTRRAPDIELGRVPSGHAFDGPAPLRKLNTGPARSLERPIGMNEVHPSLPGAAWGRALLAPRPAPSPPRRFFSPSLIGSSESVPNGRPIVPAPNATAARPPSGRRGRTAESEADGTREENVLPHHPPRASANGTSELPLN